MSQDTQVKVAIFASSTPDYFFNHFDLSQASDFPTTPNAHSTPAWVELVLRLSKAPFISIALACDLRYASREHASFGQLPVPAGTSPSGIPV